MDVEDPASTCRICGCHKLNTTYLDPTLKQHIEISHLICKNREWDKLMRPCECRGNFAFVHQACLSGWIETTRHQYCDICCYRYNIIFKDKSFFDWIVETKHISYLCQLVGLILIVYYTSSIGILISNMLRPKINLLHNIITWTSYIWFIFSSIALVICLINGIKNFKAWKVLNRQVTVKENNDPQLELKPRPNDVLKSSGFRPQPKISNTNAPPKNDK